MASIRLKQLEVINEKKNIHFPWEFLIKDKIFTISLLLAIASCFIHPPKLESINLSVLISLFNLMITTKALEDLRILDKMAITIINKCKTSKSISAILIFLCFFSSMIVTNDVALLTFVPLTLIISKKTDTPMMETIILQTIAANVGSSLTPMGNPQNLFIYSHYHLQPKTFFLTVFFMAIVGAVSLYLFIQRFPKKELAVELPQVLIKNRKKAIFWGIVMIIIIASIFGIVSNLTALFITLMAVLLFKRTLFFKVDYYLLFTFICLFIFIGNISDTTIVQNLAKDGLQTSNSVFFNSILASQFISNVPASILLGEFTTNWKPLLLGVNIGGLGTIIASMASVISFKFFIAAHPLETKKYLLTFSLYNFGMLALFSASHYFLLQLS